ncbi:chaperonin 10-like protein [Trametes polyzona]|nr:chaperonin 10-like protein [Trametes polyzona]
MYTRADIYFLSPWYILPPSLAVCWAGRTSSSRSQVPNAIKHAARDDHIRESPSVNSSRDSMDARSVAMFSGNRGTKQQSPVPGGLGIYRQRRRYAGYHLPSSDLPISTMKAIRYHGPEDVRLDDIPEPKVGPRQVKVKVAWCGICGSDLHVYHGTPLPGLVPTATEPHPNTGETLPVVLGHEFSGTIVELGPEVDTSKYAIGQNVAVEPLVTCMKPDCPACSSRDYRSQCQGAWALGMSGRGGGLSEYVVVDQHLAHILPPNTSLETGALIEPLAVAWRAVKRAHVKPGDKVLILGAGPIALFILHVIKLSEPSWIGVSGRRPLRCELAREHGASAVYDLTVPGTDVVSETLKTTQHGADIVIICAGSQETTDTAVKAVRAGGTILNVADWPALPAFDMNLMLMKEITLVNSLGYSNDHPPLLEAVAAGKFTNLDSLITSRVSLEDYVEKGINALHHDKDRQVKILIHP